MDTPKESICPHITNDNLVLSMLKRNYGLTVTSLKPLDGYDDRNYHAKVESEHCNTHLENVCVKGYLVKIVNHLDSKLPDFQMGQKMIMDRLNASGIKCQTEIQNVDGEFFSSLTVNKNGEDVTYTVSVRSFLEGSILNTVALTSTLAYDVGSLVARVCESLQGLEFKFYDDFVPLWSMDKFLRAKEVLDAVKDLERRKMAEEIFEVFETEVVPRKKEFLKGMVHGDFNEQNILVRDTSSGVEICGLIDFQDSCFSYCIYDLSIAIAYMMMLAKSEIPFLDAGGHILAGYEKVRHLNDAERKCLRTLVASRMVMSLVYGAYYNMLDPSNTYLLATSYSGWNNLLSFWKTEEKDVWRRWDEIIKSYVNI